MQSRPPTLTSRTRGTYRDDHITPSWVLDIHRKFFGHVDIDLASSAEANVYVQAQELYFSANNPCPSKVALPVRGLSVWCNPPGPSKRVRAFWDTWCDMIARGAVGSFLCFSIDHFRMLKDPPTETWVGFLRQRVTYVGNTGSLAIGSALITSGVDANDFAKDP